MPGGPLTRYVREPVNALTHGVGAVLSTVALYYLISVAAAHGGQWHVVSAALFGATMVLLYGASALYHGLHVSPEWIATLRRIDHMAIFGIIAGTYSPFCLVTLQDGIGWALFLVIWTMALAGVLFKLFWMHAPRRLSTSIYVAMGWTGVFAFVPLRDTLPPDGMAWLLGGGVAYTVGGIVYGVKRPNPWPPHFGFHELWHLFVMAGSACHFVAVYVYVLPQG